MISLIVVQSHENNKNVVNASTLKTSQISVNRYTLSILKCKHSLQEIREDSSGKVSSLN
jgi:hypothetical protein